MSLLQQLLDNNELYCYYDFRSGTYLDYTGNTTLTGTADTSLVKGKLIIPSTKRLTIGSLAIGTNDFSIVSKTRPQSYSKHILGATGFNLTVYSEFDLSTFFGGSTYYNSANQSKLDLLRWNQIGATYNRDGNVTYYENGLSFRTIDISGTSAVDKTDTYYLGYTNAGFIEYNYFLIAKKVLTATEMAQLTAELENKKWTSKTKSRAKAKNILVDGDMKMLGVTEWSTSGATLTKIDDVKRWLRVTGTGNNGQATQRVLVSGKTYRVTGYGRGDGTARPRLYLGNGVYAFIGVAGTAIQYIDVTFTAPDNYFSLMAYGASGAYCDFANIQISEVGSDEIIYKTESGIRADQKIYSTANTLIDGTDLRIESGSWKIIDDTYNGEKVKALQCVSSGTVNFSTSSILKQTPTESAYGEWEFVASKAEASNLVFVFVAEAISGTVAQTLTYNFLHNTSEEIDLRQGGTVIMDGGAAVYPKDTYYRVKITRTSAGVFTLYINDTLIGSATNTTYTLANYVRIDIDTGDKIILSSERGTYGIIKK